MLASRGLLPDEAGRIALTKLSDDALQSLAVRRSRRVDMRTLVKKLDDRKEKFDSYTDTSAIEGALLRLKHIVRGRMGQMYGQGGDTVAIEDFAHPNGLVILEGGAQLNEYAKAALLSLMAWHIYTDSVARRTEALAGADYAPMFVLLEEGNKIVSGVDSGSSDDGPDIQSDIFPRMFRDAGKYNIYLGIIAQSPSVLPPGIISSCNNLAAGQLKNSEDVETVMAAIGRSPTGFVDTHYSRFIQRMQQAQFILKLGLSMDVSEIEPVLYQPLLIDVEEPSNAEIAERYA